jgi:hypothetical protein
MFQAGTSLPIRQDPVEPNRFGSRLRWGPRFFLLQFAGGLLPSRLRSQSRPPRNYEGAEQSHFGCIGSSTPHNVSRYSLGVELLEKQFRLHTELGQSVSLMFDTGLGVRLGLGLRCASDTKLLPSGSNATIVQRFCHLPF